MISNTQKVTTVTVGIAAYNEEKNIGRLLDFVINQDQSNFFLEKVIVISDGSTDSTASIVREYAKRDSRIIVSGSEERLGKIARLNWLFTNVTSDILVVMDADIIPGHDHVIKEMVSRFNDKSVGLVGAPEIPFVPREFMGKIFYSWNLVWRTIKSNLENMDSVHNNAGCFFALSNKFYKKLDIPREVIAEDEFLFFEVQLRGMKFVFCPNAHVYYYLPKSLKEYIAQSARFITTKDIVLTHFGTHMSKSYDIPASLKFRAVFQRIIRDPFFTILALILQTAIKIYCSLKKDLYVNNVWNVAKSSKQ